MLSTGGQERRRITMLDEKKQPGPSNASPQKPSRGKLAKGALFEERDYIPFMLGIFIIGGLLAIPLIWGSQVGLGYFEALPWSLASCAVFLVAIRRNGTISWLRFFLAIIVLIGAGQIYASSSGKPAFAAGGMLGFLVIAVCGLIGIGVGRLILRK